jgi:hypothetical protein
MIVCLLPEHHRQAGCSLAVTVWFPYRRWLLVVILNLPGAIALRAVLTIAHPPAAITMWTNLHCRFLSGAVSPGRPAVRGFCFKAPR